MKPTKYPKTLHLPWSESIVNDDGVMSSTNAFNNQRVIVSEKMDGEGYSMYRNTVHAGAMDSVNHPSRDWVKGFWGTIRHKIPHDLRICGENCYAKHSIHYTELESYFLGFSVWREVTCLSWDETLRIFKDLGISPVKTLYDGVYDEELMRGLPIDLTKSEGYIVRVADEFLLDDFDTHLGKYVRDGQVQASKHWMKEDMVPNILSGVRI